MDKRNLAGIGIPFFGSPIFSPQDGRRSSASRMSVTKKTPSSLYSSMTAGRSTQSLEVVYKSSSHVVEKFGVTLPVQITENLTICHSQQGNTSTVSIHITSDGWAWFVWSRHLLIWQCKTVLDPSKQRQRPLTPFTSQCRELTLPHSDLAHRGDLVSVYTTEGNQVPSCIAVSPGGTVRFWPSITHESLWFEENADLQGQECDSLTSLGSAGCILSTTTSTLMLVTTEASGGRHSIQCRTIRTPSGWLGGIGKRMSSLIFGGLPSSHVADKKLVKVIAVNGRSFDSNEWRMYALGERSLQKWLWAPRETEPRIVFEMDIKPLVREAFYETFWENSAGHPSELEAWMLDMQSIDDGVMILAAAVHMQVSPQLHFALVRVVTDGSSVPTKLSSFCPLKHTSYHRVEGEPEILRYKFVLFQQEAYIFNDKHVVIVSTTQPNEEPDYVEFAVGDRIMGGALCGYIPAFFTKNNGLISISPSDYNPNDFLNSSMASFSDVAIPSDASMISPSEPNHDVTLAVAEVDLENMALDKDPVPRLKAAFMFYARNKRDMTRSTETVADLFPRSTERAMDVDAPLDLIVTCVYHDLVNDMPAGDPRWQDRIVSGSLGTSSSMQILQQLEDKQKGVDFYITFLKDMKLWDMLSALTTRKVVMATPYVLGEYSEKLVAATVFRSLHAKHATLLETGIKAALTKADIKPTEDLTHQDLFYKEVTQVHRLLQALVDWSERLTHSDRAPQDVAAMLAEVNTVILSVLLAVIRFRQEKASTFSPTSVLSPGIGEYLPWTSAPGPDGVKDALELQLKLTSQHATTGDMTLRNELHDQMVNLLDLILDGRKCHLESLRDTDKFQPFFQLYQTERYQQLRPFLIAQEYERAAMLAEKYLDFKILVEICELTDNDARRDQYMERFADQNFSQFVFGWYVREGKTGRMLKKFSNSETPTEQKQAFAQFLTSHPSLSWLLAVFSGDYKQARNTLTDLAKDETELLARKKSMLSLAKLSLLAMEDMPETASALEWLNAELDLICHQEQLPDAVLAAFGYDTEQLRVLTPTELIKLQICDEYESATEFDFKKALDLLVYIDDEFERGELRHYIWCQAVKRDSWSEAESDAPINAIQKLLFFKLADLISFMGADADTQVLPPLDRMLEANELEDLRHSKSYQFLLKVGYEHVHNALQESSMVH